MLFSKRVSANAVSLIVASLLLTACAKQQIAGSESIQSEAAKQAGSSGLNANDIIQETKEAIDQAVEDQLEFYAPLHLNNAREQLEQAEEFVESPPKENPNAAITSAIAAKSIIQKAYDNKELVVTNLKDVLATKKILDELDVQTTYRDDYEDSLDSLSELIVKIETGALKEAIQEQPQVIEEMVQLEIRFLQKKHLQKARQFLVKAYEVEADDYAPITFIKALEKIEHADAYIRKNYRNRIGVEKEGHEAFLAVQQAYYIAIDTKSLVNLIPEDAENHVVNLLIKFDKINQLLAEEELLPQSFKTASERLISKAKLLKSQHDQVSQSLLVSQATLADLREKLEKAQTTSEKEYELADADWLKPSEEPESEAQDDEDQDSELADNTDSSFEMMDDE